MPCGKRRPRGLQSSPGQPPVLPALALWSGLLAVQLWDGLVYLGPYRADRAGHPIRLIRLTGRQWRATRTYTYLTNGSDPRWLPAASGADLYRRRWDFEPDFDLVKTHLGLKQSWSRVPNVLLQRVDPWEGSLELRVRCLPQLAAGGREPVTEGVTKGRRPGYIRPVRRKEWLVPASGRTAGFGFCRPYRLAAPTIHIKRLSVSRAPEPGFARNLAAAC